MNGSEPERQKRAMPFRHRPPRRIRDRVQSPEMMRWQARLIICMLPEMPSEMVEAQNEGFTFFAGELEETRLDEFFQDAWNGTLKPLYNFMLAVVGLAAFGPK